MKPFGPMRILYINHTGEISGAERVLLQMLRGLDRERYEPSVLCGEDGPLRTAVDQLGINCITMKPLRARFTARPDLLTRYILSILSAIGGMRKQIKLSSPDLIHANTVRAGIVGTVASVGMRVPIIWHVHDILPKHPISTAIRILAYISRRTRVVCVSSATADAFRGTLKFADKVTVLHNGVDLTRFPQKTPGENSFKAELGLAENHFLFCAVGQLAPRKGLRELLLAFSEVCAESEKSHLAIVGEAIFNKDYEYQQELLALTSALGLETRVHFTGARRDIPSILQSIDVLVLNSLQEPFGLVLVEAMSSGTAVVAANVGGIPEIVSDGITGWLICPTDRNSVTTRLLALTRSPNLLSSVQEAALTTVCPRFSLNAFLDALHCYYAKLNLHSHIPMPIPARVEEPS